MMTNCCCRACVSNILRHNCRQVIRRYMTMCFKLPAMHGVIMICRYGRKWNSVGQCWCFSPDSYVMHRHICGHRMSEWDVCRSIYIHISWGDWYWWSVGSGLYYQNLSDSSFQKKIGTSPLQYINKKKVERAQLLLCTTDMLLKFILFS